MGNETSSEIERLRAELTTVMVERALLRRAINREIAYLESPDDMFSAVTVRHVKRSVAARLRAAIGA